MRTWNAFKTHFRTKQSLLLAVNEDTLQDSRIQQANLVQQVVEGVQNMLINMKPEPTPVPAPIEEPILQPTTPTPVVHSMNTVQNNELIPNLLSQIAQIQNMMLILQQQIQNQATNQAPPPNLTNRRHRTRRYC